MKAARVSVIITSCNQEGYLREAIDSALGQTVKPSEIIVADDHSTKDNSVALIRSYMESHATLVKGLFHSENIGIPKNRNSALAIATGDYVVVLDGDDRLLPEFIARHLHALADRPEAGCSYSNRYHIDPTGRRIGPRTTDFEPSGDLFSYIAAKRMGILRSMMASRDLVREAGNFDERFIHHDGFILTLRLAKLTKFVHLPEPLMEKRLHAGGFSKTISIAERIRCFEDVLEEIQRLSIGLPNKEARRIRKFWDEKLRELRASATTSPE